MHPHAKNPLEISINNANISRDLHDLATPIGNPTPTLAVVVPCYNEEAVLPDTHAKLSAKLEALMDSGRISAQSFLCYVDDGSRDRTWEILKAYAKSPESSHDLALDSVPPPPRIVAAKLAVLINIAKSTLSSSLAISVIKMPC